MSLEKITLYFRSLAKKFQLWVGEEIEGKLLMDADEQQTLKTWGSFPKRPSARMTEPHPSMPWMMLDLMESCVFVLFFQDYQRT